MLIRPIHCSIKTISRSAGRSATAASAYRSASKVYDVRTGMLHDYTRKDGVLANCIRLPDGAPSAYLDRETLWNAAEAAEKRCNSTVSREWEVDLPAELNLEQQIAIVEKYVFEIIDKHQIAIEYSIHAPSKKGDQRNYHCHIQGSTRRLGVNGFGEKSRELDEDKYKNKSQLTNHWRKRWAAIQNELFEELNLAIRVTELSHMDRGIEIEPTKHLGPSAIGFERRTGQQSRRRLDMLTPANDPDYEHKNIVELKRKLQKTELQIQNEIELEISNNQFIDPIIDQLNPQYKSDSQLVHLIKSSHNIAELEKAKRDIENQIFQHLLALEKEIQIAEASPDEIAIKLNESRLDTLQKQADENNRLHQKTTCNIEQLENQLTLMNGLNFKNIKRIKGDILTSHKRLKQLSSDRKHISKKINQILMSARNKAILLIENARNRASALQIRISYLKNELLPAVNRRIKAVSISGKSVLLSDNRNVINPVSSNQKINRQKSKHSRNSNDFGL